MTEPDEGVWRIWAGAGLLAHAPVSDALRSANAREDEREKERAVFEAELRAQADLERVAELQRRGHVPHSVSDVLARAISRQALAADKRQDKAASADRWARRLSRGWTSTR